MSHISPYSGAAELSTEPRPASAGTDARDLLQLWTIVCKRWRVFLVVVLGFFAIVVVATIFTPKAYTTTVRLMAGRPSSDAPRSSADTALPVLNALVLESGEQSAETLAQLAQQRDIAARVIERLGLSMTPQALLSRVSVKPVVNTALLNLSVSDGSPQRSADIANTFANAFVEQERDFVRSQAVDALGYLSAELPAAQRRVRATAARLARFQATHGFVDAGLREQDVVGRISTIDQKIDQLLVDQNEARTLLQSVRAQSAGLSRTVDSAEQVGPDPTEAAIRAKLSEVEAQLTDAESEYTPTHPAVIALKQERQSLVRRLETLPSSAVTGRTLAPNPLYQSLEQQASTYSARVDGDQAQVQTLRAERAAYGPEMRSIPAAAMAFATLREDATRAENVYNALQQKNSDALVAKATAISDILVVAPATADAATRSPSLAINAAVALVVGTLLGVAVVLVLDLVERHGTNEDIESRLGLPIVARIPNFETRNPRMLPWVQSMTVESFLHLCVTLRRNGRRPLRTLLIVSPCRGDGKSTVSYNLAKAMSTLQCSVLLVDADLRRPTLHEKSGITNGLGLSDVLVGSTSLDAAVVRLSPKFDILTSGAHVANPVVLLEGGFTALLRRAEERYDLVIIDAPALAAVSDALLIATQVDGTLLVVAVGRETEARGVVSQMSAIGVDNVLGIVTNKDKLRFDDYADYFATMQSSLTGGSA